MHAFQTVEGRPLAHRNGTAAAVREVAVGRQLQPRSTWDGVDEPMMGEWDEWDGVSGSTRVWASPG